MKSTQQSGAHLSLPHAIPPLSALLAFERAATHLNFRRAAHDLAISPSAISHQIRGLEERFGVRLFARAGRSVRLTPDGELFFVGRRDDIVKVRGNRIALGEIEAALHAHPDVLEAAVVVRNPGTLAASLTAFLVARGVRPKLLEIKAHCADRLPRAMIVDRIRFVDALPRTPNGKVDRSELVKMI